MQKLNIEVMVTVVISVVGKHSGGYACGPSLIIGVVVM